MPGNIDIRSIQRRCIRLTAITAMTVTLTARAAGIEQLGWLAGCWSVIGGEAGSGEQWTLPAGGTMFGIGRTIRNGSLREYEYTRIAPLADGRLAFHALPSGQAAAIFPLLSMTTEAAVFEDLAHDFPQRVIYRHTPDGLLAARIEGQVDGKLKGIDLSMQRTRCEAGP